MAVANRKTKKTNPFAAWVRNNAFAASVTGGVIVAVIAVFAFVAVANSAATDPGTPPSGSIIDSETGAISFGENPDRTIETYVDFICPACGNFETVYGPKIEQLVDQGDVTLQVHPISILDRASSGTKFSTRSASAMYCVAENDPDAAFGFFQGMFANQPKEGSSGLDDLTIVNIARDAGAGDESVKCIEDGTYTKWVTAQTKLTPTVKGKNISTPTVLVNGEIITLTGDFDKDILANLG